MHGDERVEPGAGAAPDEEALVVEGGEVALDGADGSSARSGLLGRWEKREHEFGRGLGGSRLRARRLGLRGGRRCQRPAGGRSRSRVLLGGVLVGRRVLRSRCRSGAQFGLA
ncbi:MAG: hypothetical protein AVDCRST_MAG53-223, partial [uncultured Solirubrobacteraceae bacterium]